MIHFIITNNDLNKSYELDKLKIFSPSYSAISSETIERCGFKQIKYNETNNYADASNTTRIRILTNIESSIIYSPLGVTISVNPTQWLLNSNERQITYNELCEFIPSYLQYLNINNDDFHITGLDFNQDILMNHPPSTYLSLFDLLPRFNKTIFNGNTGIQYQTSGKTRDLIIYDKVAEMEAKGKEIPLYMQNENRLRIEFCINKNFSNSKLKSIRTLTDLLLPSNYNKIVNEWYRVISSIHKIVPTCNNLVEIPDTMEPEEYAIMCLVDQMGLQGYHSIIDIQKDKGMYPRSKAYRKKIRANEIISLYNQSVNFKGILDEFNFKINEQYQSCLQ